MDYAGKHTITGYLLDTYGDASFARKGCDAHTLASTREQRQQSLHWSRGARSLPAGLVLWNDRACALKAGENCKKGGPVNH